MGSVEVGQNPRPEETAGDLPVNGRFREWQFRLLDEGKRTPPTIRYLFQTEVHVYALSVAACVLLSFFPFLIVMVSMARYMFRSPELAEAVRLSLKVMFPGELEDFLWRNLWAVIWKRGPVSVVSMILLLITANGIFQPIEVALNRAWGVASNRSYWANQAVAFLLILVCGGMALCSFWLTAAAGASTWLGGMVFRLAAPALTMAAFGLIFWLLPNRRVPLGSVVVPSLAAALALELLKYVNLATWKWQIGRLSDEYGPFKYSAALLLWAFVSAMIILAAAEWSSRLGRRGEEEEQGEGRNEEGLEGAGR